MNQNSERKIKIFLNISVLVFTLIPTTALCFDFRHPIESIQISLKKREAKKALLPDQTHAKAEYVKTSLNLMLKKKDLEAKSEIANPKDPRANKIAVSSIKRDIEDINKLVAELKKNKESLTAVYAKPTEAQERARLKKLDKRAKTQYFKDRNENYDEAHTLAKIAENTRKNPDLRAVTTLVNDGFTETAVQKYQNPTAASAQ